jgi:hypothetical protein
MHHLQRASLSLLLIFAAGASALAGPGAGNEFFEKKIRPVLAAQCFECHSAQAHKTKGKLALDSKSGLLKGGDSGPVFIGGKPGDSLLIKKLQHDNAMLRMPKGRAALDATAIADFIEWIKIGAPIPNDGPKNAAATWEEIYQQRLRWWSLQPVLKPAPPTVANAGWGRNEIDRFILARLEAQRIAPSPEADALTLARRLSFALTGLPPTAEEISTFAKEADAAPETAYAKLVDRLLASPHFGERWARHWMDVVHYADTHGYEWDHPAKAAWLYRDYLIRAFNGDVSYRQLVLEHIAGDLLEAPRIDKAGNLNESMLGTASLRLGERRHGDSAEFEGIHQEAIENAVDTISKAFLATTVACARCHDHKLDAIAQKDYYALAGIFMSSRWVCRVADGHEDNAAPRQEIARIKAELHKALAKTWRGELETSLKSDAWKRLAANESAKPESLTYPLMRMAGAAKRGENLELAWKKLAGEYAKLRRERIEANAKNTRLLADFSKGLPAGWHAEGFGLRNGFVHDGEIVVADQGPEAVRQILPAGLYTHAVSPRLNGALRSPLVEADTPTVSIQLTAGVLTSVQVVVDNAMFPESRFRFVDFPALTWHTVGTLPDEIRNGRRIFLEINTKAFNNYYPPRTGLVNRYSKEQQNDPRCWFGVTKAFAGPAPQDELGRFEALFNERLFANRPLSTWDDVAERFAGWLNFTLKRWEGDCGGADAEVVVVINELLKQKLLTNRADVSPEIAGLVEQYRAAEARVHADRTIGAIADYMEGRDDRIAIRGAYTDLGQTVPRGNIRFLESAKAAKPAAGSGRLELAQSVADAGNPLTARVYVNRVWQRLFGEGLVRTVDDFGHLGELPSHPELLDYLATRFVAEGWSTKKLIRLMVLSATWRQTGTPSTEGMRQDPENRLWHHYPLRRLEAEAIRDAILAVSGRLDPKLYGLAIDPYRRAVDEEKRLCCGPLDGDGRRSIYTKMTLMEPPKFLALFNQPIPKVTVGRRDVTNVPDQALALLNDPFVIGQAEFWGNRLAADKAGAVDARLRRMFAAALGRPPEPAELDRFRALVSRLVELHKVAPAEALASRAVWRDLAHAVFNLKEFIYVR